MIRKKIKLNKRCDAGITDTFLGKENWGKGRGYIHLNNEAFNFHCFLYVELQSDYLQRRRIRQRGHGHAVGPGEVARQ